jgi:hypothetical protein
VETLPDICIDAIATMFLLIGLQEGDVESSLLAALGLSGGTGTITILLLGIMIPWIMLIFNLYWLFGKFPAVMKTILLLPNEIVTEDEVHSDSWALGFILYSLVLCILWYAYRYNPKGTGNPSWTAVFG